MSGGAPPPCVAAQDDSAATGEQPWYTMPDGSKVETQVLSAADSNLHQILYLWTQKMRRGEGYYSNLDVAVVGFDVEWSMVQEGDREDEINPRVTLLKLGTKYGCLLVKLDFKSSSVHYSLRHFLLTKNITFVGVHTKEDLIKLKCDYGLVIRNVVDLADMNDLKACGCGSYFTSSGVSYRARPACKLMSFVNDLSVIQRARRRGSWPNMWEWVENWGQDGLTEKQIEVATVEAYLVFTIADKLLKKY